MNIQQEKIKMRKNKIRIRWSNKSKQYEKASCVIYRFEDTKPGDFNNPENILAITEFSEKNNWEKWENFYSKNKLLQLSVVELSCPLSIVDE